MKLNKTLVRFGSAYPQAFHYYRLKKGGTLAAASSFYIILAFIPSILLLVRLLAPLLGNIKKAENELIIIGQKLFPHLDISVIAGAQHVVHKMIKASTSFSIFTILILAYSGLAFINSVWNSLYLITDDPHHDTWWTYLKGLVVLVVTFIFLLIMLFLPSIFFDLIVLVQQNAVFIYLRDQIPFLTGPINLLLKIDMKSIFVQNALFINTPLLILFFALLYRWFYSSKITFKESLFAASTFVASLLAGKLIFFIYFSRFGGNILRQYGDFSTYIVPLLWSYIVMCMFYYGFCICHALVVNRNPILR